MSLLIDLLQTSQHPNDKSLQQDSFLTVDAYAAAVPFYMKNGFVPLNDEDVDSATRLLYFDLNDIVK